MRIIYFLICIQIVITVVFGCKSADVLPEGNNLDFKTWRSTIFYQFDSLVLLNKERLQSGLANAQAIRKEIEYVDKTTFNILLGQALKKNKVKSWSKLYVIYNYFEGEVNFSLSSFVFYSGTNGWGITYNHSLKKYYLTKRVAQDKLNQVTSLVKGGGNDLLIISEFNDHYCNTENKFIIGASIEDEAPQIIELYDKSMF